MPRRIESVRPSLETLEDRNAPSSGIPDPQFTVIGIGSTTKLADTRLGQDAIGKVVSDIQSTGTLPGNAQFAVKLELFFHQNLYHGSATVVALNPPPGTDIPTDPKTGLPTTARYVLSELGGSYPVIILPDGVNVPQGAGNLWEVRTVQAGWFTEDPPGVTNINAIPPGPDSQSQLSAPNFAEGELVLFGIFGYLELHQPGLLPLAAGFLAQVQASTGM